MSASVGTGKSSGKSSTSSPAADKLAQLAELFSSETKGIREGLIGNMAEILKTGGSTIPIISQAVEQSRRAGSQALSQTQNDLALQGLSGTPFGSQILANTRLNSEANAAKAQQALALEIFNMIPNFILGQSQTSTTGLANAISGMNTTKTSGKEAALGGAGKI